MCGLCIIAFISVVMVFVVSLTLVESLDDKIKSFTPLMMQN